MDKENKISKGKYRFAVADENYEDYSSGRVLYGASGATNFPVRLSSEIFQRCKDYLEKNEVHGPYALWDPFCGAGYSLTTLGFLHNKDIKTIFASDTDMVILETTSKNLSLLSNTGLERRVSEIKALIDKYGKDSHKDALLSTEHLKKCLIETIPTKYFQLNVLTDSLPDFISNIDIIITDLPYGQLTQWTGVENDTNPTQTFLDKVKIVLNQKAMVAIVSDKKQKITFEGYIKLKTFNLGKRRVWLLEPIF